MDVAGIPAALVGGQTMRLDVTIENRSRVAYRPVVDVIVSRNAVVGDGDDLPTGAIRREQHHPHGRFTVVTIEAEIPGTVPAGAYHVGVSVGLYRPPDGNLTTIATVGQDFTRTWIMPARTLQVSEAPSWTTRTFFATHADDLVIYSYTGDVGGEFLSINGDRRRLPGGDELYVDLGWGNDKFIAELRGGGRGWPVHRAADLQVKGFAGKDTIIGGDGDDLLIGGNGKDKLLGADGSDTLMGNAAGDYLDGYHGLDLLFGHGGNDRLVDFSGDSTLLGGAGNDLFITTLPLSGYNAATLSGGAGHDRAQLDANDDTASIEQIIA